MVPHAPFLALTLLAGLAVAERPVDVTDRPVDEATITHLREQIDRWRYQAVADTLDRFLARAEAGGDSLRLGQLRCLEGQAELGLGRVDRSLELLEEAREIAIAEQDTFTWMTTLGVGALGLGRQGRFDEVVGAASRQIELARETRNALSEAYAQASLGYAALQTSRLELAEGAFGRAIELFDAQDVVGWDLTARIGAGRVASEARRFDDARRWFDEVLRLARTRGDAAHEFDALNNLGTVAGSNGRNEVAARYLLAAAELQARAKMDRARRITVLGNLVGHFATHLPAERVVEALNTLEELRREAWSDGELNAWSQATFAIGTHYQRTHRSAQARALYVELMEQAPALGDRQRAALIHASMVTDPTSAAVELDRLRRLFPDPDALSPRLALWSATVHGIVANCMGRPEEALVALRRGLPHLDDSPISVDLLSQHAYALVGAGRADEGLDALERAIGVLELLSDRSEGTERGYLMISGHQTWLVDTAARLLRDEPADRERREKVFALLQRLRARSLLRELDALGDDSAIVSVDLPTIQTSLLDADEVFLDFYQGNGASLVFVVRRDLFEAFVLETPARALGDAAARLVERIASTDAASPSEAALRPAIDRMRTLLCGPFEGLLQGASRLTIAPDGRLARLPFPLMFDASTVTSIIPGIVFRKLASSGPRTVRGSVVALTGRDSSMPGARREVRSMAGRFDDVTVLSGWVANWEASMRGAAIVHVATHAEVDVDRPWRSGFRLDPSVRSDDSLLEPTHLRAGDVMRTRLDAGLAVLSACASGTGRPAFGEGVIGLTSAFLIADCRAVVSTLWPVDDAVTADLMEHFYDRLAAGASVEVALEDARRKIRANPRTAAPVHWAGFFVIGYGDLRVDLEPRDVDGRAMAALGVGLVALLGLFWSIRRRRIGGSA